MTSPKSVKKCPKSVKKCPKYVKRRSVFIYPVESTVRCFRLDWTVAGVANLLGEDRYLLRRGESVVLVPAHMVAPRQGKQAKA